MHDLSAAMHAMGEDGPYCTMSMPISDPLHTGKKRQTFCCSFKIHIPFFPIIIPFLRFTECNNRITPACAQIIIVSLLKVALGQ